MKAILTKELPAVPIPLGASFSVGEGRDNYYILRNNMYGTGYFSRVELDEYFELVVENDDEVNNDD